MRTVGDEVNPHIERFKKYENLSKYVPEDSNDWKYYINNVSVSEDKIGSSKYPNLVVINDEDIRNTMYAFETEDDFTEWYKQSSYASQIEKILKGIEEWKKEKRKISLEEKKKSEALQEKISSRLKKLSKELNLPISSYELIREAKARKILNSFLVWDLPQHQGDWRAVGFPMPDFGSTRFDNKASSLIGWGIHVLCDMTYWRYDKIWIFGYWNADDLSRWRWSNRLSSSW
jgi:hypothetical protein